jgi:hypothetical protein
MSRGNSVTVRAMIVRGRSSFGVGETPKLINHNVRIVALLKGIMHNLLATKSSLTKVELHGFAAGFSFQFDSSE